MLYGSLFGHSFNSSTFCDPFILWSRYVGSIKRVVMRWWISRLTIKNLAILRLTVDFSVMVKLKSFTRNFLYDLWLKISPFLRLMFVRSEKLSNLHNFINNLSTHFSIVILEEQPTPSKSWIWDLLKPTGAPGGPAGVWFRLLTVVLLSHLSLIHNLQYSLNIFICIILQRTWILHGS